MNVKHHSGEFGVASMEVTKYVRNKNESWSKVMPRLVCHQGSIYSLL